MLVEDMDKNSEEDNLVFYSGENNSFIINDAAPFVKWAGGKRGIINEIISRLPEKFNNYYEPFLGGGALFFQLYNKLTQAYLSDVNIDLLLAFEAIKKDPEKVILRLKKHSEAHGEDYYYSLRSKHNLEEPLDLAARFIYLNKTCYNGLFRTNNSGEFNVPIGKYTNPQILDKDNIFLCSNALKKALIEVKDFSQIKPTKGDFVYFDPPYHPIQENSFTKYSKLDFTENDQIRLRNFALHLHKKGVNLMISNSNTSFINDLYKNKIFNVNVINAPRFINSKGDGRKSAEEVIIRNYG